jgi:hypothetical protein
MVSRLDVADPGLEPSDQDLKTAEVEFAGEIAAASRRCPANAGQKASLLRSPKPG